MSIKFQANLIISGEIVTETGLKIGGSSEGIEIGGVDSPVIRDSRSDLPYIPGSSLKGKERSLKELSDPEIIKNVIANKGGPCECGKCVICIIFGTASKDVDHGPTRLIIRDSFPTQSTIDEWKNIESIARGTEMKHENTIKRLTSEATPRSQERVPKGSKFSFEKIYGIYSDEDYDNIKVLFSAMKLLEDNYLGGSGTRGYGKIKFEKIQIKKRSLDYYKGITEESPLIDTGNTVETILKDKELINRLKTR